MEAKDIKTVCLLLENNLTYSELLSLQHKEHRKSIKEKYRKTRETQKEYDFWQRKYADNYIKSVTPIVKKENPEYFLAGMRKYKREIMGLDLEIKVWKAINKNNIVLAEKLLKELEQIIRPQRKTIPKKIVQRVYEDNIKQYGTLTCYLCGEEIEFGKDSIDHIKPVMLGGSNDYDNLKIAHKSCNSQKHAKPLEKYLKWRKDKQEQEIGF